MEPLPPVSEQEALSNPSNRYADAEQSPPASERIEEQDAQGEQDDQQNDQRRKRAAKAEVTYERVVLGFDVYDVYEILATIGRRSFRLSAMGPVGGDTLSLGSFRADRIQGLGNPTDTVSFTREADAEAFALPSPEVQALCRRVGGVARGVYLAKGIFGIEIIRGKGA